MKPAAYSGVRRVFPALLAVLVMAPMAAAAPRADEATQMAETAFNAGKLDDAIALLRPLTTDSQLAASERFDAFAKIMDFQGRNKKYDDALATAAQMLEAFRDNDQTLYQIYLNQSAVLWSAQKWDQAVDALHQAVARAGNDKDAALTAYFRALDYIARLPPSGASAQQDKKYPRLYAEAEQMLPLLAGDARTVDVLWSMCEAAAIMGQWDKAQSAARRIIDEFPESDIARSHRAHERILDCLRHVKNFSELRTVCAAWEKSDPDIGYRQRFAFEIANSFSAENDASGALNAYRHVITAHAADNASDLWYEAQNRIVDLVAATGDLKAALQEAHICFDASPPGAITWNVERIADLLVRLDKKPTRANQFIDYQRYGPAGPDGKAGTADDLVNPLDECGYPADSERHQAFAAAFPTLGNDADAAHHRATLCLYIGQPRAALYYFMEAFRRGQGNKFQDRGIALVVNGLRAAQGHSLGLTEAVTYVVYGPNGKDGKPGTADDLPDPFQAYASFTPPDPFVAPNPSALDIQRLKDLQATLRACAVDPVWPGGSRMRAFAALGRVNEALEDWPNADWYFAAVTATPARYMRSTVLASALSAAKGKALHLGNVRAYLASLTTRDTPGDKEMPGEFKGATSNFQRSLQELERLQKPDALFPRVKPRR